MHQKFSAVISQKPPSRGSALEHWKKNERNGRKGFTNGRERRHTKGRRQKCENGRKVRGMEGDDGSGWIL